MDHLKVAEVKSIEPIKPMVTTSITSTSEIILTEKKQYNVIATYVCTIAQSLRIQQIKGWTIC